jgi:hypothetical protein
MLPVYRTFSFRKVCRARDYPANSTFEFASRDFYRLVALAIHLFCTLRLHTVIQGTSTSAYPKTAILEAGLSLTISQPASQ